MASYQVRDRISNESRHGRSKAQMCLQKILDFIVSSHASLPHCDTSKQSSLIPQIDGLGLKANGEIDQNRALFCGSRGFDIDLNIGLGAPSVTEESESAAGDGGLSSGGAVGVGDGEACVDGNCKSPVVSADVSMAEKSSEGECAGGIGDGEVYAVGNGNSPVVSADVSTVHENSSDGEGDPKEVQKLYGSDLPAIEANHENEDESAVVDEEEATESSEITNLQLQSSEIDNNGVSVETEEDGKIEAQAEGEHDDDNEIEKLLLRNEEEHGCLNMLIEAAKLISGGDFEDDGEPGVEKPNQSHMLTETETDSSTRRSKRNHCWLADLYGDFEDVSPVVRSKRGRSQVLPHRYRDSVLEPLARLSRQRSTTVSTKRRSR